MTLKATDMIYTKDSQVLFKPNHTEYDVTDCIPELLLELEKLKER